MIILTNDYFYHQKIIHVHHKFAISGKEVVTRYTHQPIYHKIIDTINFFKQLLKQQNLHTYLNKY